MNKIKLQNGLPQEILITIYKLIQKKTSQIFREPVDAVTLPDYYQKIKQPIDIATVINKLKEGKYQFASQIREDFRLMMDNCRKYNVRIDVLKTADKFERSIQTQWGNFEKDIKKKDINYEEPITINQETLKNFQSIQDRFTKRRPSNLQAVLGELQQSKKPTAEYRILPPIPPELIQNDRGQNELPKQLAYHPSKYINLHSHQRYRKLQFNFNREYISNVFDQASVRKLVKYKKILLKKVLWIQNKIIKKCLERKRFKKMSTPQFLSSYIENGDIATNLQLRKLQMYVKMTAYWIQEYPQILSYPMKNKFIDACRSIKRSIFRVLRYRKAPRSTKIQVDLMSLNEPDGGMKDEGAGNIGESKEELLGEEESRRYDNQIKSFKRMLSKDQGETIKKYTKIMIKNQNGEFAVIDWNLENNDKKKVNRNIGISRTLENTEENQRIQKEKRKKQERQQDQHFLNNFKTKSNSAIIEAYHQVLWIDWDQIFMRKLPKSLDIDLSKLVIA